MDRSEMDFHITDFFWIYQINEWKIFKEVSTQFSKQGFIFSNAFWIWFEGCPCNLEILLTFQFYSCLKPILKSFLFLSILIKFLNNSFLEILIVNYKSNQSTTKIFENIFVSTLSVTWTFINSLLLFFCLYFPLFFRAFFSWLFIIWMGILVICELIVRINKRFNS